MRGRRTHCYIHMCHACAYIGGWSQQSLPMCTYTGSHYMHTHYNKFHHNINIVEAHCCVICERKCFFEQFTQHRCHTINQDVLTHGSSSAEQLTTIHTICTDFWDNCPRPAVAPIVVYKPNWSTTCNSTMTKEVLWKHHCGLPLCHSLMQFGWCHRWVCFV